MQSLRNLLARLRPYRFGILALALCAIVYGGICASDPKARGAGGDGTYSWLYARSLAFDGDIDFKNDYALCGDWFEKGIDRGTGHPDNPFYPGPSLFWLPTIKLLTHFVHAAPSAPDNVKQACVGAIPAITLLWSPVLGVLTLVLSYLLARRWVSDGAAALGVLLLGLGGPSLAYSSVFVGYSHVYASFGIALLLWTSQRAHERFSWPRWLAVVAALALSILMRPQLIVFGVVPLAVAWGQFGRTDRRMLVLASLMLAFGAVAGVAPTLAVFKYLYGRFDVVPQGRHYLHLAHAHPLLTLFAPHGGLLFHAPVAWLSLWGIVCAWRRRLMPGLLPPLLLAMAFEWWLSSSTLDWGGAWSLGARRMVAMAPALIVFAAIASAQIGAWVLAQRRRALVTVSVLFALPMLFTAVGSVIAYIHGDVSATRGATQEELYGGGAKAAWKYMAIEPAIFPAQLYFAARYRMPLWTFRTALETDGWYERNYAKMSFISQWVPTTGPMIERLSRGFAFSPDGLVLPAHGRGRWVFSPNWPFASRLELEVRGPKGTVLRGGVGHWFGRASWFDEVVLSGEMQHVSLTFGEGDFDSGLLELVVEADGPGETLIHGIAIWDDRKLPPAY